MGFGYSRQRGYVLAALAVAGAGILVFFRSAGEPTFRGASWTYSPDGGITDFVASDDAQPFMPEPVPTSTTRAVVREFNGEEGWGVLDAPELPGGCWVFYSSIEGSGFRMPYPGQHVTVEYVDLVAEYGPEAEQDWYRYRAERVKPLSS
ncbi:cold shock domain-containing protein [Rhodococcus sp. 14-2483-1-1]|uniref:cold-shock protein n=1 Tax=Rhodococcus sp. 14-2483-1-1 TaxID=2023148 RepID=UPI001BAF2E67|nr:cold shock domain-containing protein [Rhodococcus sp. 14-2483-1-1]